MNYLSLPLTPSSLHYTIAEQPDSCTFICEKFVVNFASQDWAMASARTRIALFSSYFFASSRAETPVKCDVSLAAQKIN